MPERVMSAAPASLLDLWQRAGFSLGDLARFRMEGDGDGDGDGTGDGDGDKGGKGATGDGDADGDGGKGGKGSKENVLADLAAERDRRQAAEREAKATRRELDDLKKKGMTADEQKLAEARDAGKSEAAKEANERLVRAEVKAAAGGKLADPNDAVTMLDLTQFEVDKNGDIDEKAVAKAIEGLLEKKPYLAASGKRPKGNGDGGVRKPAPAKTDMSQIIRQRAGRS